MPKLGTKFVHYPLQFGMWFFEYKYQKLLIFQILFFEYYCTPPKFQVTTISEFNSFDCNLDNSPIRDDILLLACSEIDEKNSCNSSFNTLPMEDEWEIQDLLSINEDDYSKSSEQNVSSSSLATLPMGNQCDTHVIMWYDFHWKL